MFDMSSVVKHHLKTLLKRQNYIFFYLGKTITVAWTIMNAAGGVTKHGEWYDRVWISPTRLIGLNFAFLTTIKVHASQFEQVFVFAVISLHC